MNWQEACRKECAALAELLIKKQRDYGNRKGLFELPFEEEK